MMMRLLLGFLAILLLAACATGSLSRFVTPADEQLFIQGMSEFDAGEKLPPSFRTLQQEHPASPWSQKVHLLQQLVQKIKEQQQTVQQLEQKLTNSGRRNQHLETQLESLEKDLDSLETERKKLRQLLIDLEQRGR